VSQSLFDHFAPYAEEILKQLSIIRLREIRERERERSERDSWPRHTFDDIFYTSRVRENGRKRIATQTIASVRQLL